MGWKAYPFKNGEVLCGPSLKSGSYSEAMEELTGLSVYWQPEERAEPCLSVEAVKESVKFFTNHPKSFSQIEPERLETVKEFLKWCSENECGVWYSY